jgi:hypothetical protein
MYKFRNIYNPEMKENINSQNITKDQSKTLPLAKSITLQPEENKHSTNSLSSERPDSKPTNSEKKVEKVQKPLPNYIERESELLLNAYGYDNYVYMKALENNTFPYKSFYNSTRVSEVRTKMIDWMVEVLAVFKCEENTLFLAVHLLDYYMYKSTHIVRCEDIHLLGVTAMFIASKFEDLVPLQMSDVIHKIAHNAFSVYYFIKLAKI